MKALKLLFLSVTLLVFTVSAYGAGKKPAMKIHTEEVSYSAGGLTLNGYLAYDESTKARRPGVLVVHEWWGHNDYARKRARMLAEMGYTALAVDMYGDGKEAAHPDDAGKFANEVFSNLPAGEARFTAAMDILKANPYTDTEKIAAIGYCFGGGVVLHMARVGTDLKGVVSFHGSLGSMHTPEPGTVKAAVLVANGADDSFVTKEQIDALKAEMEAAGADYRFVSYPGAVHSFTNPAADGFAERFGLPLGYNKEADEASWRDMKEFFDKIFK